MDMTPRSSCCLISYGHNTQTTQPPCFSSGYATWTIWLSFFSRAHNIQTEPLPCFSKDMTYSHPLPCFSSGPDTLVIASQPSSDLSVIPCPQTRALQPQHLLESSGVPLAFSHAGPQGWPFLPLLSEDRSPPQACIDTQVHVLEHVQTSAGPISFHDALVCTL